MADLDPIQQAARDQFARQSANYGAKHILAAAVATLAMPPCARCVDVAAATGHTGLYLASLGHDVTLSDIAEPMKQPDLEWYFETAATPPANREAVIELVRNAPGEAREAFRFGEEAGKIIWWWSRLTLTARKE